MFPKRILVTGSTGFIGTNLVKKLVSQGSQVTCFVRPTSDISGLKHQKCSFVRGDVVDSPTSLLEVINSIDVVFHLAASTRAVPSRDLVGKNVAGTKNVLNACAIAKSVPTVVLVSSLSAVGPCADTTSHSEAAPLNPVSYYGRSKAACEMLALEYSSQIPISIVRPPVVLGEGDRNGLRIFRVIDEWGWHLVPGFKDRWFSTIHVGDLTRALIDVAERGLRLTKDSPSRGVYFASNDHPSTYADLGRMVGQSLGRRHTRIWRVGWPSLWVAASINDLLGHFDSRIRFLNKDKFREVYAGSWACSNQKIKAETGFSLPVSFQNRLDQTADWYRRNGWLRSTPGFWPRKTHPTAKQHSASRP